MVELVDVEVEVLARRLGLCLAGERELIELGDEESAQEIGVLLADEPVRELRQEDLPPVHDRPEIEPALPLPDHAADHLRTKECIQSGEEWRGRLPPQERKLTLEVVEDLRVS